MKRTLLAIAAATATFTAAIGLVSTGGWLISMAALRPPLLTLEVAIVSVRAFGIARGGFRWLERVISHDAALHDTVTRRAELWGDLAQAGPRGAWALRRGDALTRVMQDAEVLQDRVTRVVVPAAAAAITLVGCALLQWRFNAGAGLAFLLAAVIAGVLVPALTHRIEWRAAQQALAVRGRMNGHIGDLVAHRDELRVLGHTDTLLAAVGAADAERVRIESRAAVLAGLTQWLALVASGLAVAAGLLAGVPALLDGALPGPDLAVIALLPWSASEVILALATAATALVRVRSAEERLATLAEAPAPVPALHRATEAGLRVRGLRVRWGDQEVTRGIDLDVAPGQAVAIVGPSGSGKSSIVSALLGLTAYDGEVAVGAADVSRRADCITAVPQAPHVFATSVRENLRLAAGPVDDEHLVRALTSVGLEELALDRDLGAQPLSGGEAQRLGLARALLTGAPVVVLDEPTEHLDEATAARVLATIRSATADRALVMTTHRLADLGDFDRVVVLEAGRIMCVGTLGECLSGSEWFRDAVGWCLDKARVD